ncbi:MAG: hypothetical protein ABIA63_00185 [bacterium]
MPQPRNKNYGLNWQREVGEQSEKDWIFGAASPVCIAEGIPAAKRERYLPAGEIQESKHSDMMDCASRGPANIIEYKLNYLVVNKKVSDEAIKFLRQFMNDRGEVEISDAWIAINSFTTQLGNSMKAPLDAVRTGGIIPKKLLPLEDWMTWEDYHNPGRRTDKMFKIAKKSLECFNFNYEKVKSKNIKEMLDRDVLNLAGFAWPEPVNGEYPRVYEDPNHVFMGLMNPPTYIFDNYLDEEVAGDFIKKLADDYYFMDYGYRIIISENKKKQEKPLWQKIMDWLNNIYNQIKWRDK